MKNLVHVLEDLNRSTVKFNTKGVMIEGIFPVSTLAYFSTWEQIYAATLASIMAMLNFSSHHVFGIWFL